MNDMNPESDFLGSIVRKSKFKLPSITRLLGSIPFRKDLFPRQIPSKFCPFATQAQLAVKAKNMAWIYDVSKGELRQRCWRVFLLINPLQRFNSRARKKGLVKG